VSSKLPNRLLVSLVGVSLLGGGGGGGVVVADAPAEALAGSGAVPPAMRTSQAAGAKSPAAPSGSAAQLIAALGPVLAESIGASAFPEPEATCLDAALDALQPEARAAVDSVVVDPTQFHLLFDDTAEQIASAYIGCVDEAVLAPSLTAATSRVGADDLPCVTAGWADSLTPVAIASSLAYGDGFDDLPPDVVDRMTLAAATCVPDQQWWIDDEASFLETTYGLDPGLASCVTMAVVDAFGVGPIIERRVLTLAIYPVAFSELESVVTGGCGLTLPDTGALNALPGTCLAGFAMGTGTEQVSCDQPHNAEVVTVVDLTAEIPEWPGWNVLRQTVLDRCHADFEALAGDLSDYSSGWDIGGRQSWEQADRVLTCMIIHPDFSSWTGASGLVQATEGPPSSSPAPTTVAPAGEHQILIESLSFALSRDLDGTVLPAPDPACFAAALDGIAPEARGVADELTNDPLVWEALTPDDQRPLVSAYAGCGDLDGAMPILAIGMINSIEAAPCVSDAWREVLTTDLIVASISDGQGLDDLPPDVVETMTTGAAACLPDEEWWIEDIALDIDQSFDLSPDEARCVARSYVTTLGIEAAIRRRVLTIPTLALAPTDFESLQLSTNCGVDITLPPVGLGVAVGDCIAAYGSPESEAVDCVEAHNAEVLSIVDLATVVEDWPGIRTVTQIARDSCIRDVETAVDGSDELAGYDVYWRYPGRRSWEQGGRLVSCVIGHADGSDWTGPSGVVPTQTATSTTTEPPTVEINFDNTALTAIDRDLRGPSLASGSTSTTAVPRVDPVEARHPLTPGPTTGSDPIP
jgi:hypothetical protein